MNKMITKTKKPVGRFTIRPNRELGDLLRYNYELYRMELVHSSQKVISLNEYICEILSRGIETMEVQSA